MLVPAPTYVPLSSSAASVRAELGSDRPVGCMRGLGSPTPRETYPTSCRKRLTRANDRQRDPQPDTNRDADTEIVIHGADRGAQSGSDCNPIRTGPATLISQ